MSIQHIKTIDMTLNEIIEDLEHTIEYFEPPKTQVQVGRIYQAEKTLNQLRLYDGVGGSEQLCLKCGNTGRCEPRTLSDPDGQECDCVA